MNIKFKIDKFWFFINAIAAFILMLFFYFCFKIINRENPEKNLKTTYGSECALTSLAVDEPLEYARLYLDGNLQMWVDTEDSLELY